MFAADTRLRGAVETLIAPLSTLLMSLVTVERGCRPMRRSVEILRMPKNTKTGMFAVRLYNITSISLDISNIDFLCFLDAVNRPFEGNDGLGK